MSNKWDIGDKLRYIGKLEAAFDEETKELMEQYLVIGKIYTIEGIFNYSCSPVRPSILLHGVEYIYFPMESFIKLTDKEIIIEKYNLK